MLLIWKEKIHGGIATRDVLIDDLVKNQEAESCSPLILALKRSKTQIGIITLRSRILNHQQHNYGWLRFAYDWIKTLISHRK